MDALDHDSPWTTTEVAEMIASGDSFERLFAQAVPPSQVFAAMVAREVAEHLGCSVKKVEPADVDSYYDWLEGHSTRAG
jgi:hypothetical protein